MSTNISYPYPVWGHLDDIQTSLLNDLDRISIENFKEGNYLVFKIQLNIDNDDILNKVKSGKAVFGCEIFCDPTFFRRGFTSSDSMFEIKIHEKDVCGKLTFSCYVVATQNIVDYTNQQFHPDYDGFSFDLEPGNILAVFPEAVYPLNIDYDRILSAGSFVQINEDLVHDEPSINITGDIIEINLPQQDFAHYKVVQRIKDYYPIYHASLVSQALDFALDTIDEYDGKTWAETIMYRLNTEDQFKDLNIKRDKFEIIQRLLDKPWRRMIESMIRIVDKLND